MDKFLGVLTIIFVIAKLFNLIAWSWWLVFLPAILYAIGFVAILFVIFILKAIESAL